MVPGLAAKKQHVLEMEGFSCMQKHHILTVITSFFRGETHSTPLVSRDAQWGKRVNYGMFAVQGGATTPLLPCLRGEKSGFLEVDFSMRNWACTALPFSPCFTLESGL